MLVTEQTKEAEVETPAQNNPFVQGLVDKITEKAVAKGFEVVDKKESEKVESKEEKKPVEKKKVTKKKTSVKEELKGNKGKTKKTEKKGKEEVACL